MKTASKDFVIENNTLKQYKGSAKYVEIPSGIEVIGGQAFSHNPYIETVVMPDTVKVIKGCSFDYCPNLKNVKFSANLERIGNNAFFGCDSLDNIIIPRSVKSIGEKAFSFCKGLKSVVLPATATMGKWVFEGSRAEIKTIAPDEPYPDIAINTNKLSGDSQKKVNQIKLLNQQLNAAEANVTAKDKRVAELNAELEKDQKDFENVALKYRKQIADLDKQKGDLQKQLEGYEVLKKTLGELLD